MLKLSVRIFIAMQFLTLIQMRSDRFQIEIYNSSCSKLTKLMKVYDCTYRKVAENKFVFNEKFMFSQNLGKDFEVRIKVKIQLQGAQEPRNLVDVKVKVCDPINNPIQNRLIRILINEVQKSSTMPRTCPIKGNILYKMTNGTLSSEYFPAYTPFFNFSYRFELYNKNIIFGVSEAMGAFVPAKK